MRTAVILPVKRFSEAKQRLGASGFDPLRRELARAMVGDVLEALASVKEVELTILVTREPTVAALACTANALIVADDEQGQSAAVSLGVRHALEQGMQRALCIPGDCPALDPAELTCLLGESSANGTEVVIVPDRHGSGTNGLLLTPPDAIAPSFGPDSCARHRELAAAARTPCRIARPSSLLLDIDTGEDLAALRERLGSKRLRASRTRSVLETIDEQAWQASHSAA
jgi:2-phospho-L-lactate/phosphoenolpyruvate guanylyltransferase